MPLYSGTKPDFTSQNETAYKTNIDNAISAIADESSVSRVLESPLCKIPMKNSLAFEGTGFLQFVRESFYNSYKSRYGLLRQVDQSRPRINERGLLIESDCTNTLLETSEFHETDWVKENTTATDNTATGPHGVAATADKIEETAVNDFHGISQAGTNAFGVLAGSIFAKAEERTYVSVAIWNATDGEVVEGTYNLSNGTKFSGSGKIEAYADGWYRITMIGTSTAANSTLRVRMSTDGSTFSYLGVLTNGLYLYGAQLEENEYPTSYAHHYNTVGGTRDAEELSLEYSDNIPSMEAFTIAIDVWRPEQKVSERAVLFSAGQNVISYEFSDVDVTEAFFYYDGVSLTVPGHFLTGTLRIVVTYDGTTRRAYVNGVEQASVADTPHSNTATDFHIGWDGTGKQVDAYISNFRVYDFALTADQVRAL